MKCKYASCQRRTSYSHGFCSHHAQIGLYQKRKNYQVRFHVTNKNSDTT